MTVNEIIGRALLISDPMRGTDIAVNEASAADMAAAVVKALGEAGYSLIRDCPPEKYNYVFCTSCYAEGLPCHCENDA